MSDLTTDATELTRRAAALAILADYEPDTAAEFEGITDPEASDHMRDRYLLIEVSTFGGGAYPTTHASPADAASYHDNQEYPGDWQIDKLVDLDTGIVSVPVTTTTWKWEAR